MVHTHFISISILSCFCGILVISCESHEQKADHAFELVKEEKMMFPDSANIDQEIIEEPTKVAFVKKNETLDEWNIFRVEVEKKIRTNELAIKEIKNMSNADLKLLKKMTSIEQDNNDVIKKMDEYKEEEKVRWENFKTTINHNTQEISIELKDIKLNN